MTRNKDLFAPVGSMLQLEHRTPPPTLDAERYLRYIQSVQEVLEYWPAENPPHLEFLEALEEEARRVENMLYAEELQRDEDEGLA